jgi:hypothetical protein
MYPVSAGRRAGLIIARHVHTQRQRQHILLRAPASLLARRRIVDPKSAAGEVGQGRTYTAANVFGFWRLRSEMRNSSSHFLASLRFGINWKTPCYLCAGSKRRSSHGRRPAELSPRPEGESAQGKQRCWIWMNGAAWARAYTAVLGLLVLGRKSDVTHDEKSLRLTVVVQAKHSELGRSPGSRCARADETIKRPSCSTRRYTHRDVNPSLEHGACKPCSPQLVLRNEQRWRWEHECKKFK